MAKAKDSLAKSKRRSVRLKKCWRSKSDRGGVGATVRRGLSSLFPRNRERSLELEVQQGFTGDRGWLAARGQHLRRRPRRWRLLYRLRQWPQLRRQHHCRLQFSRRQFS